MRREFVIESALMTRRLGVLVALLALVSSAAADKAKKPDPKPEAKKPAAAEPAPPADDGTAGSAAAVDSGLPPHIEGPKLVDLGNDTEIDLPAGMILLERKAAQEFVARGGSTGESIVAVIANPD